MRLLIFMIFAAALLGCKENHNKVTETKTNSDSIMEVSDDPSGQTEVVYGNSVKGHREEMVITGNFTGLGIDTIYVVKKN